MQQNKNVQAAVQNTPTEAEQFKKVTDNHWTVYYYLLSISYKNYHEFHRYVYRKDINITQASKDLGINRQTFYNSLKALQKVHLIIIDENSKKQIIYINIPEVYATISKDLLIQLLSYRKILTIDLLRTYLFVKIVHSNVTNKDVTIRNIVRCLGHSDTTSENYKKVEVYLNLLKSWKLIDYKCNYKLNETIGGYRVYNFTHVNNSSEELTKRMWNGEIRNNDGLTKDEEEYVKRKLNFLSEEKA